MKVTRSGLIAITCILNEIIESDNGTNEEISLAISFLKSFKLSDEKLKPIVDEACKMSFDDATAVVKNMDKASKQELSNIISEIMLADGAVSDEEAVKFMALIADCDVPMPDTKAWVAWCNSTDNDEIDDLSGEDSEICFFVIRAGGPHYGGKCRTVINKKYEYGISDSMAAKMLLDCKEHILYDCGESELLDMLTREMGFEGYGRFHGYVCKNPYDSSDNRAASEIFGKKISGHCLIRFRSNEGQYLELNKAQCARLYGLLKENLTCKLLHRAEDQCHFHTSGPTVMRLGRQPIEVKPVTPTQPKPVRTLSDDEKIERWLNVNRPEDNGFEFPLSNNEVLGELNVLCRWDEDNLPFNTIKELILYVIEHDAEQPYDYLVDLSIFTRIAIGDLKMAAYWAHKAIILGESGLEGEYFYNFGFTGLLRAYEELGNCYFSVDPYFPENPYFPNFRKAADYYQHAGTGVSEIMVGRAYLGLGDYAKAEACFSKNDNSDTLAWRGHLYNITHQTAKAEKCWEAAIKGDSGWGEYFIGRYLWNKEFYDSAIRLWRQGEAKGCAECTGELFNWIFGHPQSRKETKDQYWNKVSQLHDSGKCVSGNKYVYKYANDIEPTMYLHGKQCSKEYSIELLMEAALNRGINKFCPYCLYMSRENKWRYENYSEDRFKAILIAWGYNEQEHYWSTTWL